MILFGFQEEVKFLAHSSVNHCANLVKLIGFCSEEPDNGGVYDLNLLLCIVKIQKAFF